MNKVKTFYKESKKIVEKFRIVIKVVIKIKRTGKFCLRRHTDADVKQERDVTRNT